jgi:hypothetical protein
MEIIFLYLPIYLQQFFWSFSNYITGVCCYNALLVNIKIVLSMIGLMPQFFSPVLNLTNFFNNDIEYGDNIPVPPYILTKVLWSFSNFITGVCCYNALLVNFQIV